MTQKQPKIEESRNVLKVQRNGISEIEGMTLKDLGDYQVLPLEKFPEFTDMHEDLQNLYKKNLKSSRRIKSHQWEDSLELLKKLPPMETPKNGTQYFEVFNDTIIRYSGIRVGKTQLGKKLGLTLGEKGKG